MRSLLACLALAGLFSAGCGESPCDHLQKICDKCVDPNEKTACDETVSGYKSLLIGGDTDCQAVIDSKAYDSCGS